MKDYKSGFAAIFASRRLLNKLGIKAKTWREGSSIRAYVVSVQDWHKLEYHYQDHSPIAYQEKPVMAIQDMNQMWLTFPTGERVALS